MAVAFLRLLPLLLAFLLGAAGHSSSSGVPLAAGNSSTWDEIFLSALSNDSVQAFARNYTSTAHLAGTAEDYQTALYTKAQAPSQKSSSSSSSSSLSLS